MALTVRNGTKGYAEGKFVLNNLNMSVARGEIYGLLGASGCGKTTLLSCVVGLRKLDSGDLIVFAQQRKGHLGHLCGYMPQEISLLNIYTIHEALHHFGMIYGMSHEAIETKIKFLTTFLDLPPTSRIIEHLSGGQKRRVSLAVVMIHNPALLILDEPTVGLDPLLRQRIWEHLVEISRTRGTTIVISTHYIEECNRCDKVGFMRGGQLLAEDAPSALLTLYNCPSLEQVALQLCRMDENHAPISTTPQPDITRNSTTPDWIFQDEGVVKAKSFRRLSITLQDNVVLSPMNVETNHASIIHALVVKAWRRRKRDWRLIFSELCIPVFVLILFQNIVGLEPRILPVSLVTNDVNLSNNSQLFQHCAQNVTKHNSSKCLENAGICNYLETFENNEFEWITTTTYQEGYESIQKGKTVALLAFPGNFGHHMKDRIVHRNFADNETIDGSTITIALDESNSISSSWMKVTILTKYINFIANIATACSSSPAAVRPPLQYNAIYGGIGIQSFLAFTQPGIIMLMLYMMSQATGVLWILDRTAGLEDRDYAAGASLRHRIAASVVTDSIKTVIQMTIFLTLLFGFYNVEIRGSWIVALSLIFVTSMSGVAIGCMICSLRDRELEVIIIMVFVNVIQAYSSGSLLPLDWAPWYYRQFFCNLLPSSFASEALRSITSRGWGLDNFNVARGFLSAAAWGLFSLAVVVFIERRRHK
ncbi:ABC transporter G family member 23 [Folsomia candida]|uniref:ABC transporter G family member 23 n=1 Tax=Folsomia candida TaxID=158441 RepID=UPI000B8EEF14|nr:ABC transporter G family member 23 [Folsomia candida]